MNKGFAELIGYTRRLHCQCGAVEDVVTEKLARSAAGWMLSCRAGWRCPKCRARADEERLADKIFAKLYPKPRGFAAMSPEQQRGIASSGGRKAHADGTAHKWSAEEARRAGQKGGLKGRMKPPAAVP